MKIAVIGGAVVGVITIGIIALAAHEQPPSSCIRTTIQITMMMVGKVMVPMTMPVCAERREPQ